MLAGQKGYGANGKQNFLFPLEDMFITQGEWEYTYSHNGTYAMDFQGWSNGSRVYQCPCYAPFDCHCVEIFGSSAPAVLWESDQEVNFVDGTVGYACIGFTHEDNTFQVHYVGQTLSQGDIISHTGTMGASGDHVHIEAKKGQASSSSNYHQNSYGGWMLTGSTHLYDLMGINDTVLTRTYYDNHNNQRIYYPWLDFTINNPTPTPVPPSPTRKSKFPWVLYARKLRKQ